MPRSTEPDGKNHKKVSMVSVIAAASVVALAAVFLGFFTPINALVSDCVSQVGNLLVAIRDVFTWGFQASLSLGSASHREDTCSGNARDTSCLARTHKPAHSKNLTHC
eukprot:TRINITY_DN8026_c0_g1_i1.p2 TRINITY_DN8026_c0_g1~~TRINITY_DN8026_c0_g1_i1.p2  ORF type:complete len:108 (+),score=2.24 TRINITY_DN8026_c0_g1_i1:231-554(+)